MHRFTTSPDKIRPGDIVRRPSTGIEVTVARLRTVDSAGPAIEAIDAAGQRIALYGEHVRGVGIARPDHGEGREVRDEALYSDDARLVAYMRELRHDLDIVSVLPRDPREDHYCRNFVCMMGGKRYEARLRVPTRSEIEAAEAEAITERVNVQDLHTGDRVVIGGVPVTLSGIEPRCELGVIRLHSPGASVDLSPFASIERL